MGGPYQLSIDLPYLDGISITFSAPRKHIWSYGVGLSVNPEYDSHKALTCPCSKDHGQLYPLWVIITTVNQALVVEHRLLLILQLTFYGTVKVVGVRTLVVHNPTCCGSSISYH